MHRHYELLALVLAFVYILKESGIVSLPTSDVLTEVSTSELDHALPLEGTVINLDS